MIESDIRNRMRTWILVCGILSVVFYILHDVIGAMSYPGYEPMRQAVSDLTATDAPSFARATGLTTVYKIFSCICCTFICVMARDTRKVLKIGIYLFALMNAISAVGYALFPLTGSGYDGSVQSFIHVYVLTAVVVPLSIASLILISVGCFKTGRRTLGIPALIALGLMFLGAVGSGAAPKSVFGIFERFSTYSAVLFTGVLSLASYRRKLE